MVPSTIKTICNGVALAAVTAIRSAGGGWPLSASAGGATATGESSLAAKGRVVVAASIFNVSVRPST